MFRIDMMMLLWRLIFLVTSWITVPLLFVTDRREVWTDVQHFWVPKDAKMLLIAYLLNYLLPITDVSSDVFTSISYYLECHYWFSITTLLVTFFPFGVKLMQELVATCKYTYADPKVTMDNWKDNST